MNDWRRVAAVADVPMLEGRSVSVAGQRIAVFRLPSGWAAVDASCPHRGGPLQDGIVADSCVICPLHNRRFDLKTGQQTDGTDAVAVHEVAERDDGVWIRLAATEAKAA